MPHITLSEGTPGIIGPMIAYPETQVHLSGLAEDDRGLRLGGQRMPILPGVARGGGPRASRGAKKPR
jgi:hypothetical protein